MPHKRLVRSVWILNLAILVFALNLVVLPTSVTHSATFSKMEDNLYHCRLFMEGVIEKGDAEKFKQITSEYPLRTFPLPNNGYPDRLCLNSKGGSLSEAIKIANMLRGNGGTVIKAEHRCESACAIIFMAGSYTGEIGASQAADRIIHPTAKLGFHRPSLEVDDGNYSKDTVEYAFDIALLGISELVEMGSSSDFPPTLLVKMLQTPPENMFYVEYVWQAVRWEIMIAPTIQTPEFNSNVFKDACNNLMERFTERNLDTVGRIYGFEERSDWNLSDKYKIEDDRFGRGFNIALEGFDVMAAQQNCQLNLPFEFRVPQELSPIGGGMGGSVNDEFMSIPQASLFNGKTPIVDLAPKTLIEMGLQAYRGYDLSGGDLKVQRKISKSDCFSGCAGNVSCTAATYDRWNNICVYKDFTRSKKVLSFQPKADTVVKHPYKEQVSYSEKPMVFKRRSDREFPWAGKTGTRMANQDECEAACLNEKTCLGFEWSKAEFSKSCRLYDIVLREYQPRKGVDIGIKEQK